MEKITVIDSIMGSGKTSWAIQHINESLSYKKFIYITPYLDEVERIKKSVTNRSFVEPNNANEEGRKLRSLKELIVSGNDIVATHSLFQMADDELIELLTDAGYTLILDEVMDVIEKAGINSHDIKALLDLEYVEVVDNKVRWVYSEYISGRFYDIKLLANAGNLFYHRGKFLIWSFPPQVFKTFDEVFVMTYLFKGQIQRYYYDLHKMECEYKAVKHNGTDYELIEYNREDEGRQEIFELIDLYEGKLNDFANRKNALSATWLRSANDDLLESIQKNIYNYFRNVTKAKAKEILWTTIKDSKVDLSGKGYTKGFIPCNMRATNEYASRSALAYVFNRFLNPIERSFFEDHGVRVDEEMLAVSDLLQWVWRSRIRNGEPIKLYLPSSRMRRLLKEWAEYDV
ncbi:hypothetical protein D0U04_08790 [Bacillus clarus]|uniref:Uncharacterized protein n=1 Tax=Bacillus clarus TaxID=2338372 RepID=A0A090YTB6_9BACI|nr:hypothetical protein [Bacillus clarus]KFN01635.1 hypothetical protein DJ93_1185 [Bacillus clarus]RFT67199.1 hypothetical protein D0U04_08790 [Bacillus clarus]